MQSVEYIDVFFVKLKSARQRRQRNASGKGPTQQTLFFGFLESGLFVLLMLMLQNKITVIVISTTHVNSVKNNVLYSEL